MDVKKALSLSELVNKRILVKIEHFRHRAFGENDVEEVKILEHSPSLNYIKIQNIYGTKFWILTDKVKVVEILKDIIKDTPK